MRSFSDLSLGSDLSAAPQVPLIDQRVMDDWRNDMDKADVADILARVPGECAKSLTEFEKAIAVGDLALARRSAHRLKGMANNLGASRLAQLARSIELGCPSIDDVERGLPILRKTLEETLAALPAS